MPDPQNTRTDPLIGRLLCDGEYQIQRVLGQGGMGKVFLAIHTTLRIPFALKQGRADQPLPEQVVAELDRVLHSSNVNAQQSQEQTFPSSGGEHTDRFLREALLLKRLEHPSIPTLYDYFAEDGYWYLVMDYVPGPTLHTYLRSRQDPHKGGLYITEAQDVETSLVGVSFAGSLPLAPLEALNYAMQLCDVLDYLHQHTPPIIFYDLKPSNVILTPDGALMLVDFGIARYFKTGPLHNAISDSTGFGSPGYASPEQHSCENQTDMRSDLYSLGVILHEMLSGRHPQGIYTQLEPLHTLRPDISTALGGLVELATCQDTMGRFQSAHVFYQALERVYSIEESRVYQHRIAAEQNDDIRVSHKQSAEQAMPSLLEYAASSYQQSETIPVLPTWTMNLALRRQTRERVQRARQAQQTKVVMLEQQLTSIDESLKRRARLPFSQTAPSPSHLDERLPRRNQEFPCALWIGFLLVMTVLLVLASLLFYARYITPAASSINMQTTSTPGINQDTQTWRELPSLPSPEADNTATYIGFAGRPYVYISGGNHSQSTIPDYDRALYRYDILAAQWEIVTPPHFPAMVNNSAVADHQGRIFFTSGYAADLHIIPSTLYEYQPSDGILHKIHLPAQVAIGFGSSMLIGNQDHLYITQGFMQPGRPNTRAGTGWYRYDIDTGSWHRLAPLPIGLGYTLLTTDGNGSIFVFGGAIDAGQQQPTDSVYRYDIAANSWQRQPMLLPHALSGAAGCTIRPGKFFVVGGYNATAPSSPAAAWQIDLATLSWLPMPNPSFNSAELGNAACDGNGHAYIERGGDETHRPTSDFWEFVDTTPLP